MAQILHHMQADFEYIYNLMFITGYLGPHPYQHSFDQCLFKLELIGQNSHLPKSWLPPKNDDYTMYNMIYQHPLPQKLLTSLISKHSCVTSSVPRAEYTAFI